METAVVLRQREVQQLRRAAEKLAALVGRLTAPTLVEGTAKPRRAPKRAKAEGSEGSES